MICLARPYAFFARTTKCQRKADAEDRLREAGIHPDDTVRKQSLRMAWEFLGNACWRRPVSARCACGASCLSKPFLSYPALLNPLIMQSLQSWGNILRKRLILSVLLRCGLTSSSTMLSLLPTAKFVPHGNSYIRGTTFLCTRKATTRMHQRQAATSRLVPTRLPIARPPSTLITSHDRSVLSLTTFSLIFTFTFPTTKPSKVQHTCLDLIPDGLHARLG